MFQATNLNRYHADDISTYNNSLSSPLLRLPEELRNRIYTHIFRGEVYAVPAAYITCRPFKF